MLNTAITNQEQRALWSTPGWLPEEIGIIVEREQFFCYEGEDLKLHLQRGMHNIKVYSLTGMAINIESGQTQKSHLVSMVNGKPSNFCRCLYMIDNRQWHMRNQMHQQKADGTCSTTSW